jgi:zinc transport system ATP-binding protein
MRSWNVSVTDIAPLVKATGIDVSLGGRTILDRVDLSVSRGQVVTLIGPNGAGKTTLVRVMLGLLKPDAGRVERMRGITIGYMPQKLQVPENLPLTVQRFLRLACDKEAAACEQVIEELGIAHLLRQPMQNLSGGEHQRVLLARALLREPDLLVLDEPVQGVDVTGQSELYALIGRIRDKYHCGVLMISHDLHLVMATTDDVLCLNGHVCCSGHPESVSRHPAYLELFGSKVADNLAVYTHHHDHDHDIHGNIIEKPEHDHG